MDLVYYLINLGFTLRAIGIKECSSRAEASVGVRGSPAHVRRRAPAFERIQNSLARVRKRTPAREVTSLTRGQSFPHASPII
ncbi:hypothetical protein SAMN02745249_01537 [Atopostipes suicloacalis DSM 15692]|uniref:Uncharacterized protein n=1 Tax=Atopostipes suicloacalis DSM 15692 TaxID=1121025 RepID=A0A1M4XTS7_9LACT|nr:hypothetical protein SAMN02745249_01537 [Atopostipes suicloacalis DSM 15692]